VHVVPPGIDARFSPGGERSATPLVVAVGRLVPVKQLDRLITALVEVRRRHPQLEAVIVGEGYRRDQLEAQVHEAAAERWIHLPGRLDDDEVLALYRRAWVLASASAREGWGMTVTEAAACGTPAVVSRIAGHADAVVDGESGLLVDDPVEMAGALERVIADPTLRRRLSDGALAHARRFTWGATARGTLEVLAAEAIRRRTRS
jgi:glycosyltransferase involved in cell wall biosynthesis